MRKCVGQPSSVESCRRGVSRIFHLAHDAEMPLVATLELHHLQTDSKQMEVSQFYGPDNATAPAAAVAEALAADYRAAAEATSGDRRRSRFYTPRPLPDKYAAADQNPD